MAEQKFYTASRIFTGEKWLSDHVIIVKGDTIDDIVSFSSFSSNQKLNHFDDCTIAPSFIDLQIYGARGKLLAVYPEPGSLELLREYCEAGGAAHFLPTVATNTKIVFHQAIDAVRKYWDDGGKGVLGLHLEGPWINPVKRGAHIESLIHPPTLDEVKEMLAYGKDVIRMITLAPEVCSPEAIEYILSQGIIISAGHSNASYTEARSGFAKGITAITHLFNAMSPLHHREPGLVGAAMDDEKVMASIIPDGHHVAYAAIRIAKKAMKERLFVITDAVTETNSGYYKHSAAGDKFEADGILSGSCLTMDKALQNLVNFADIDFGEAIRMCSSYPAKILGLKNLGFIQSGFKANMVVLDKSMQAKHLI